MEEFSNFCFVGKRCSMNAFYCSRRTFVKTIRNFEKWEPSNRGLENLIIYPNPFTLRYLYCRHLIAISPKTCVTASYHPIFTCDVRDQEFILRDDVATYTIYTRKAWFYKLLEDVLRFPSVLCHWSFGWNILILTYTFG